jgi:hypothetical protein
MDSKHCCSRRTPTLQHVVDFLVEENIVATTQAFERAYRYLKALHNYQLQRGKLGPAAELLNRQILAHHQAAVTALPRRSDNDSKLDKVGA